MFLSPCLRLISSQAVLICILILLHGSARARSLEQALTYTNLPGETRNPYVIGKRPNNTYLAAPQPRQFHLPNTLLVVEISPVTSADKPLPAIPVGFLLRQFSSKVETYIKSIGENEDVVIPFGFTYEDLQVRVMPSRFVERTRNLLYKDLKYLAAILLIHFHELNDWPSCLQLWDSSTAKTADNIIAIGAIAHVDFAGCVKREPKPKPMTSRSLV